MSTETVLTDEQILQIMEHHINCENDDMRVKPRPFARAIEQSVLQSPEIQELRQQLEDMEKIISECRDAMPIPSAGSKAEKCWPEAMSDAGGVPDFIKASVEALRKDAERYGKLVSAWFDDDHSGDFILMNNMPPDAYQSKADIDDDIDAMEKQT
jgi:hypothetical protein